MPPRRMQKGGSIDIGRLARHLSYPGIDGRIWASIGFVTSDGPTIDTDEGIFVDVILMPSQVQETARVASIYSGPECGVFFPMEKDDEVLVVAPSGDPNEGLVVMPRLWSPSDKPPPELFGHTQDHFTILKKDSDGRFIAKGSGEWVLQVESTGKVRLGDNAADQSVVRGDAYLGAEETVDGMLDTLLAAVGALCAVPAITALSAGTAAAVAAALTAYNTARTAYKAQKSSFKQPKVKVE